MRWLEEDSGNLSLQSWQSGERQSWNEAAICSYKGAKERRR